MQSRSGELLGQMRAAYGGRFVIGKDLDVF